MAKKADLVGQVFGHLTVLKDDGTRVHRKDGSVGVEWLCQCDCGRRVHIQTTLLLNGQAKSCGHMRASNIAKYREKHMQESPGTDLRRLNGKKPTTNTSGEKNISLGTHNGKPAYRVAVVYKRKQYGGWRKTMPDAIDLREELRRKYWPNYSK